GLGEPRAFSGGIAQALRTTILGLAIAIPTSIATSIFDRKVESMVNEMERLSTILLNKLYASKVRMEKADRLEEFKMRVPGEKV
ncbi:MAG: MotA/TolQ/ExbB proton channel family protein, partial [Candidatus Brocadiales bacterium]